MNDEKDKDVLLEEVLPPKRRWTDLLEELDKRFISWQKLVYIILGLISLVLICGFPSGWTISAYVSARKAFETATTKSITALELQRALEIPKLDSVLDGQARLRDELKKRK